MRRRLWVLAGLVALSGCKEPVPLFCDEETPCTDPERPYCDLEGEFPASEGHGNTCIPDPFPDAGPEADCSASEPCTSPEASRCQASSGTCLPCEAHGDCSHLDGLELCVSGTCVACELAPLTLGGSAACGVRPDGALFCWGDNTFDQLGLSGDPIRQPTALEAGSDWAQIALGGFHACGVREDGSLWCWGRNGDGQAGQVGGSAVSAPAQVGGDTDWAHVALGSYSSCGLREDGSLWCWGGNFAGQLGLGDNDSDPHPIPERIGSATGWDAIALGGNHGCGLRGGSLYCWGSNTAGQVGQSESRHFTPTRVGSRADWNAVAAGLAHSCGFAAAPSWSAGAPTSRGSSGTAAPTRTPTRPRPRCRPGSIGRTSAWGAITPAPCGRTAPSGAGA